MEIRKDFSDLLLLLNAHGVEYVIVGGYALAHLGAPRYTGDLDIFIRANDENAKSILKALDEFGFGGLGLEWEDFSRPGQIVQLGYEPNRVDFISKLSGIDSEEVFATKETGQYGDIPVFFIGRRQYIQNKKASGRLKDLADVERLGEDVDQ